MTRKILAVGLFVIAIAVFAYGALIEIVRQVEPRDYYAAVDGFYGFIALMISAFLALIGYWLWRSAD